jgi:hypothetical protein
MPNQLLIAQRSMMAIGLACHSSQFTGVHTAMTKADDKATIGGRVTDTSDELRSLSETQHQWLAHLDSSLEAANTDLKSRIREIRERHRQARQQISDDLQALAQEIGYLPPPSYEALRSEGHVANEGVAAPETVDQITYIEQHTDSRRQSDDGTASQRLGLRERLSNGLTEIVD